MSPGDSLLQYRLVEKIGAGGMGEVYRARDTKLNRDVAIKVLPDLFANEPDRLARFTREAQTLASLNHPNIAQIYGLEESGDVRALAMELVDGEELTAHIARGPMPLAEALPIARQIADALEAAHEQGIIHRDLKPANVKVRQDGTVKVLDFGLAKAMDPVGASGGNVMNSPTLTARATQLGMILGTAAYMAPEQARGRAVDRRADIWAFGVVLYEMLAGRRAFDGEDVSITLASVLKEDVDWQALPADLPAPLRRLLRRCLEKDPRRRLSAIGDARLELDENEPPAAPPAAMAPAGPRSIGLPAALGIAAVAVLATAGVMRLLSPAAAPSGSGGHSHLAIALPDGDEFTDTNRLPLALSPDGSVLAYVGRRDGKPQLFLRRLSEMDPVALAGTDGATMPFFSPNGQWIAFFAEGRLKKVAVDGAGLQVICGGAADPRGGSWGADGNIYFAPTNFSGIWMAPASGGAATELTRTDRASGEISHRWPHALPDRRSLLYTIWTGPGADERQIVAQSIATGERRVLLSGGDTPRYAAAGYLLYARRDSLFAVPWRPSQTDLGGEVPVSLPERPRLENEGAADYAVANNGTLVYLPGGAARYAQRLLWIDRAGRTEALPLPERVSISPDGRQAAVQVMEGTTGLWLYDFSRHTLTPFVTSGGSSQAPVWTPDGRRLVYRGTRNGQRNVYWKAADGTGDEERLTTKEGVVQTPTSVSPDGQWALFTEGGAQTRGETTLWRLRLNGERTAQPLARESTRAINGRVSPDGKWLAYLSDVSGLPEIYVQPFPGPGPRLQVSNGGGTEPLWSRDGRELFYILGDKLMAVDVASEPALATGQPHVLLEGRFRPNSNGNTPYDVSADGRRFLRIQQVHPDRAVDHVEVVLDWFDELKRLAATK
ncbi:MAG: protein kinase [Acidobacteriia bacterium]|nr:protein kinase [Terriglobia bacterium]